MSLWRWVWDGSQIARPTPTQVTRAGRTQLQLVRQKTAICVGKFTSASRRRMSQHGCDCYSLCVAFSFHSSSCARRRRFLPFHLLSFFSKLFLVVSVSHARHPRGNNIHWLISDFPMSARRIYPVHSFISAAGPRRFRVLPSPKFKTVATRWPASRHQKIPKKLFSVSQRKKKGSIRIHPHNGPFFKHLNSRNWPRHWAIQKTK